MLPASPLTVPYAPISSIRFLTERLPKTSRTRLASWRSANAITAGAVSRLRICQLASLRAKSLFV